MTTTTTFRSGDDEEDAAYPSHTLAGTQAASTWDPVVTLRCCCRSCLFVGSAPDKVKSKVHVASPRCSGFSCPGTACGVPRASASSACSASTYGRGRPHRRRRPHRSRGRRSRCPRRLACSESPSPRRRGPCCWPHAAGNAWRSHISRRAFSWSRTWAQTRASCARVSSRCLPCFSSSWSAAQRSSASRRARVSRARVSLSNFSSAASAAQRPSASRRARTSFAHVHSASRRAGSRTAHLAPSTAPSRARFAPAARFTAAAAAGVLPASHIGSGMHLQLLCPNGYDCARRKQGKMYAVSRSRGRALAVRVSVAIAVADAGAVTVAGAQ